MIYKTVNRNFRLLITISIILKGSIYSTNNPQKSFSLSLPASQANIFIQIYLFVNEFISHTHICVNFFYFDGLCLKHLT